MFLTNTLYWETEMLLGCTVRRTHCFISEANLRGSLERSHRSFLVHLSKQEQRGTELTQSQAGKMRTTLGHGRRDHFGWKVNTVPFGTALAGKFTLMPWSAPTPVLAAMGSLSRLESCKDTTKGGRVMGESPIPWVECRALDILCLSLPT